MKWNHFLLRLGCCVFSFETLPCALGILLAQNSFHPSSQRAPLITPSKRNGSAEMFWRNLNTPSNLRWFMSLPDWDISRLGIHRIFILVFPLQQQWRIYQLSTHTLDGWPQKISTNVRMRMTFLNSQNHISMAASLQQFSILSWSGMWFPPTSWPFLDHSTPSTRVSCAKSRLAQTTCAPRAGFCRSCFRQPANWMGRDVISFYPNPKIDMLKHTTYIPPIILFCHLKLFRSLFLHI